MKEVDQKQIDSLLTEYDALIIKLESLIVEDDDSRKLMESLVAQYNELIDKLDVLIRYSDQRWIYYAVQQRLAGMLSRRNIRRTVKELKEKNGYLP